MEQISAGSSDMSRSFGADVDVTLEAGGLSLVVGRGRSPTALVQGVGGRVVLVLSSTNVLAYLSMPTHLAFQHHPGIAFVGRVSLDRARFAQFTSMLRKGRDASMQLSTHT